MKTLVKDIIIKREDYIHSSATLQAVVDKMAKNSIQYMILIKDEEVLGIITERDILHLYHDQVDFEISAIEYATRCVISMSYKRPIGYALSLMIDHGIRRIVILDEEQKYFGSVVQEELIFAYEEELFKGHAKVHELINTKNKVISISSDSTLSDALDIMAEKNIGSVLISENSATIGILTESDTLKLAQKHISTQRGVKEFMHSPVLEIQWNAYIFEVIEFMREEHIRHVLTHNELNEYYIVSSKDILKNLKGNYSTFLESKLKDIRDTFNQINEAVIELTDLGDDQVISWLNAAAKNLLTVKVDSSIGEIIPQERWNSIYKELKKNSKLSTQNISIEGRDFKFNVSMNNIMGIDVIKILMTDITELTTLNKNLSNQITTVKQVAIDKEKLFTEAFNQAAVGIFHVSKENNIINSNTHASKLLGYSVDELIGKNIYDITYPDEIELTKNAYKKLWIDKTVNNFTIDKRCIKKDGSTIWMHITTSLSLDVEDDKQYSICVLVDITQQQKLLDELTKSNELFGAIYNQTAMGIAITSPKNNFLQTNQKFCDLFGYTEDEFKKLTIFDVTDKEDFQKSHSHMKDINASKKTNFSMEKRYIKKDGTIFWGHVTVSVVLDTKGNPKFNIAILEDIQKRKDTQKHIEELAHLMDLNVNEVYIMDRESFKVNYANKSAVESTGYALEELLTMTPADFVLKSTEELAELFRKLIDHESNIIPFIQTVHKRKDGTSYPVQAHLQLIEYQGQEQILAVVINSTTEIQAQKEAAFQYQTLNSVLDSSDDIIYYKDYLHSNGNYIGANKSLAKLLNTRQSSIVGRNDIEIFGEEFGKKYQKDDKSVLKDLSSKTVEEWVTDVHNNRLLFNTQKTPFYNEENELVGILGIGRNITKLHEQQIEILEQKEKLENAQRIAHIGSWDLNLVSGKLNWSSEVYKIFDIDKEKNTPSYELLLEKTHPDDRKNVDEAYKLSVEQKIQYDITHRVLIDQDTIKYVHERAEHKYDDSGVIIASVGTVQDITQVIKYEEELKQNEELMMAQSRHAAMGEMIGMIAHQWRQPISVIAMAANNMLVDISFEDIKPDEFEKGANSILNQTQHLSKTIDDFRNFFRPDNEKETVMLKSIIDESIEIFGASLRNSNIELVIKNQSDTLIHIHGRELLQVYINLIKNAKDVLIDNREKDRKITITLNESDKYINTIICDNGGGIPSNIMNKIFDPYFTTKDKKPVQESGCI